MDIKTSIKHRDMERLREYRDHLIKNPRLTYLFLELTNRCNLSCLHCGSSCAGSNQIDMDTELLFRTLGTVAEDFDPESVMICLSGGEPMLHRDFFKICGKIVQSGFPWGMTTNGMLIGAKEAHALKELGIGSITVSLDGMKGSHDWLRDRPGSFERTSEGIRFLIREGIPVQVTTVIHRGNLSELNDIYEYVAALGADSWRVINIEPIGRALQNKDLLLSQEELLSLLGWIRQKRFSRDTAIDVRYGCSHYLSYDLEREVRDNYFLCGSGIYVGSILCNGDIYSCLDIERRPELIQGNIKTDRFSEVWRHKFREFRRDRTESCEECRQCPERGFCGGDSAHTWDYGQNRPKFCILRKGDERICTKR